MATEALVTAAPALTRWQLRRVRFAGALAGLAMLLLLSLAPGHDRLGNIVFDELQRIAPRDLRGMKVAVVEIDAHSIHETGMGWPWSRYELARLASVIVDKGHAAAIGFDMFFPDPDRQTLSPHTRAYLDALPADVRAGIAGLSADQLFAQTLGVIPSVLARAGVRASETDYLEAAPGDPAKLPVEANFTAPLPPTVAPWPQALVSLPALDQVALGHGLINGDPDPDGIVRHIPAVGSLNGTATPGFALELARVVEKVDRVTPVVTNGRLSGITLGGATIPVGSDGRFLLHFGEWRPEATASASDVMSRGFDLSRLAGKVVIVGLTSGGSTDRSTTPLAVSEFGPRIQAQAVDAILRGGWLDRPVWAEAAEDAAGVALALLAIVALPRWRGIAAVAAPFVVLLLLGGASWLAFIRAGLLLDPLRPLLIGGAAAAAALVTLYVSVRSALVDARVEAARAAGEMEAARGIQLAMLPSPASLAALHPTLSLAAMLEPARRVGGDFYGAFAIDAARIAFLVGDVSGKGVDAALFMALSKVLAEGASRQAGGDLAVTVDRLSAELARNNAADMFVTMLIGVLDTRDGTLDLFNAGHENPFLIAGGSISELALVGGPPLGAVDDFPYEIEHHRLAPGDGMLLITDGVSDAETRDKRPFGREGVAAALATLPPDWDASAAIATTLGAVRTFEAGAEPYDDLTMLALRWSGS